jgi:hypothetical protein
MLDSTFAMFSINGKEGTSIKAIFLCSPQGGRLAGLYLGLVLFAFYSHGTSGLPRRG